MNQSGNQLNDANPRSAGEPIFEMDSVATKPSLRIITILVLTALLTRGTASWLSLDSLKQDPDAYQAIAETLHHDHVFGLEADNGEIIPTSFRPPLYPSILSCFVLGGHVSQYAIAIFHLLLGIITAICTYQCCSVVCRNSYLKSGLDKVSEQVAITAGILVLIDPILIQQSTQTMTETLATAIASLVLRHWMVRSTNSNAWAAGCYAGLLLALAYLCRPTFLVWAVLLLAADRIPRIQNQTPPEQRRMNRVRFLAATLILSSVVLTWMLRNQAATGYPAWATTHGGYTLLLGNNPLFYEHLENNGMTKRWDATAFASAYRYRFGENPREESFWLNTRPHDIEPARPPEGMTEHEDDQISYQAAVATIQRSPANFLKASLNRIYRLWTPIPYAAEGRSNSKRAIIGLYYSLIYLCVAIGLIRYCRRRWMKLWPMIALVIALTGVHGFYWSNLRMRAPAIPVLAIFAAGGLNRIIKGSD